MAKTTLVILGATGDLTKRLLMPALYRLHHLDLIPGLQILGYAMENWDRAHFEKHIEEGLRDFAPDFSPARWRRFSGCLDYAAGDLNAEALKTIEKRLTGVALFYLALPPPLFGTAAMALGEAGFARSAKGWRRLVVEKPFGTDLASAEKLRIQIHRHWDEKQVLRIDHFLGKETTQNLMVFRLANRFLEPLWNNKHVEQVQISFAETLGVEHRAAYYEHAGALRDMLQNHLMQLFSLAAMEPLSTWDADLLRDHKVEVLRAATPIDRKSVKTCAVRGQYQAGHIGRRKVPGYRHEPGVATNSRTETFAALRLEIDNWRWQGVPFYLRSGKRLASNCSEIAIQFRKVPGPLPGAIAATNNWMVFRIRPYESLDLIATAKRPGLKLLGHPVVLSTPYAQDGNAEFSAYEQLLIDALAGERAHFLRFDEVEWAWRILEPVLHAWSRGTPDFYGAGTEGPAAQQRLLAPGHHWRPITLTTGTVP